ncbi:MAG: hypothetical protein CL678_13255 [Bdellovibrionaceae bacterium]|nr:hypothetical protein [Pseudobdellovibrionaceae bacterium]
MAIIPEFTVPTGSTRNFVSDGSFQPGIHFAIENDFEPFKLAFNIGYRNAQNATYSTIDYRNRIIAKAAGSLPIVDWLNLNIEYQTAIRVPFDFSQSPSEFYLGGVSQIGKSFYLSTGATIGSFQEDASGNYGFFVGLEWTPFDPHEGEEIKTEALAPPVQKTKFVFKNKRIVIPKSIHFEFDSPALTPSGRSIVRQLAGFLKKNDAHFKKIIIEGHTDSAGKDAYNLVLSKQRAATVRRHLIYYGIEESRLQSEGYGESRPKYPWGSAKDQRGLNRRVEFIVID